MGRLLGNWKLQVSRTVELILDLIEYIPFAVGAKQSIFPRPLFTALLFPLWCVKRAFLYNLWSLEVKYLLFIACRSVSGCRNQRLWTVPVRVPDLHLLSVSRWSVGLLDTWKMFLYAPGSRQRWKFGFTECAGSPELSWLRLGWLGPRPRMRQVLHYWKRSDELLEQCQECTRAEEPLLGVGRGCEEALRSLPTVKQRCVMTRAINFCRKPALFPTLRSPMGPPPWGPRGHWEYPICSLYHIAQKDASRVSSQPDLGCWGFLITQRSESHTEVFRKSSQGSWTAQDWPLG